MNLSIAFGPATRTVMQMAALPLLLAGAVLAALAWIASERGLHPRTNRCDNEPSDFGLGVEPVTFCSLDGTCLAGWFVPGGRAATVVLAHGFASDRRELLPHASFLHEAGYCVLLLDFRHTGESEGKAVTIGMLERLDLLGAVRFLRDRADVGSAPIGILGLSMGAVAALLAAAESSDIAAVVAECPFKSIESILAQSFRYFVGLPAFPFAPVTVWLCERRLGLRIRDFRPIVAIGRIVERPVLLIHGLADSIIDSSNSRALHAAGHENVDLWLVEGAVHARAYESCPDLYRARVLEFLEQALSPASQRLKVAGG